MNWTRGPAYWKVGLTPLSFEKGIIFSSTEGQCIGLVILLLRIPKAGKHIQHTSQKSIFRLSED